ncbi:MAG: hypothetical protein H7Y88_09300 [Phycisphaerales bacterium]|nr:hypothetical protein [Phycisphaerales bacterium]
MNRSIAPTAVALVGWFPVAALAQDCPPELFDYGSFQNPETVLIVLDHYGATGPLLPSLTDYERADRDIGLLRAAEPILAQFGQSDPWQRVQLIIQASPPFSSEFVCSNEYYQAQLGLIFQGFPDWYLLELPSVLNLPALAELYRDLPGVTSVGLNYFGCAGTCCSSSWHFQPRDEGTWRWRVFQTDCCWGCLGSRMYDVTDAGDVLILCVGDWDGSSVVGSSDITAFLGEWFADVTYGSTLADFNISGDTSSADLTAFLSAWFAALGSGC